MNVDPELDPELRLNGGTIPSHALSADSIAIDGGDNCILNLPTPRTCSEPGLLFDQRGVSRPQDGNGDGIANVDIGAFEATPSEVSSALQRPDLTPASDTGISDSDNITQSQDLVFNVTGLTAGATVQLFRNGVMIASLVADGSEAVMSDLGLPPDGVFRYSVRQVIDGNPSLFSGKLYVTVDNTKPTITVSQASGQMDPTRTQPISYAITFSELVLGFDSTDLSLNGSTAGVDAPVWKLSGEHPTFLASVSSITSDGTVVVSVPENAVVDLAGNSNLASIAEDNIVTFDTTPPTVTINKSNAQMDPTRILPINFTVVFSEPVNGFSGSDVSLAGSTANVGSAVRTVTGSGSTYNVAISGVTSNGGTVVASIPASGATDAAGNPNSASTSTDNSVTLDNVAPTVTINQATGQSDPTTVLPINFTVNFSEPVTGFEAADLNFNGSTISTASALIAITGSGANYNVAVSNLVANGGLLRVAVRSGAVADSTGNFNLASTSTDNTVMLDNVVPTVLINQRASQPDPTSNQPIEFLVQFSENVSGFSAAGINLSNSTANVASAQIAVSTTASPAAFIVSISNVTSSGNVVARVRAGAAQDLRGNANTPSVSSDNSVTLIIGGVVFDFDGDGKTDASVFRPNGSSGGAEWWYLRSSDGGNRAFAFGDATDEPVPADYTGDGKADIALWRPASSEWFILRSEDSTFYSFPFGAAGDVPMPADFDGDGKTDQTVFRPSTNTWFTYRSSDSQVTTTPFGAAGDLPVAADYDGDGKADIAIYRPNGGSGGGEWWYLRSSDGANRAYAFGTSTDRAVPGDFTGDGKADLAFWRPSSGEWFVLRSEDDTFYSFPFGISTDVPVPGDYDGDGKADAAVFRPSNNTWYLLRSTAGVAAVTFGATGDRPIAAAYVR